MIPAEGGIQTTNFPKPEIAGGAGMRSLHSLGEQTSNEVADLAGRMLDMQRVDQFNHAQGLIHIAGDDYSQRVLENPQLRANPDAAKARVTENLQKFGAQVIKEHPMADVRGQLTRNVELWTASRGNVVWHEAWNNQLHDTHLALAPDSPTTMMSRTEARTALDPKDRITAVTDYTGAQDDKGAWQGGRLGVAVKTGFLTEAEATEYRTQFLTGVRKDKFEDWSRAHPGAALTLDAAHPPEGVLPQWIDGAKKAAQEQLESASRGAVAEADAKIGGLAQDAMALAGQPGENAAWEKYREAGGEEKVYEAHTGRQFIRPSVDPGLRDSFISELQHSRPEDIPYRLDEADQAFREGRLGSADVAQIHMEGTRAHAENATADKQREIHFRNDVLSEYVPKGTDPMSKFTGGLGFSSKVNMTALDAAMNDAWAQSKGDPVKAKKIVDDQFNKYKLKADSATKGMYDRVVP
jgi:hypothetical protein